jgi:hypothetical protein
MVQAVTMTVTAAVVTAVATAVGGAVAGAVASAAGVAVGGTVAGSMGGAAGGAASGAGASGGAGSGGSAGGGAAGVAPLVFGAQRMSASSGLALNQSAMQTAVADGLGWANGKFGLIKKNGGVFGRRLARATGRGSSGAKGDGTEGGNIGGTDEAFMELLDVVVSTLIMLFVLLALRVCILVYWSRHANAKYYQQSKRTRPEPFGYKQTPLLSKQVRHLTQRTTRELSRRLTGSRLAVRHYSLRRIALRSQGESVKFKPLPGVFVFPNLETLTLATLSLGLTESAVAAISDEGCDTPECVWTAGTVLAVMGAFVLLVSALVLRFYMLFSIHCWSAVCVSNLVSDHLTCAEPRFDVVILLSASDLCARVCAS